MVLTITLNPLLEKTLFFSTVETGKVNRAERTEMIAGGKGVNVSRQCKLLGLDTVATGLLGGDTGKKHKSLLFKENISNCFVFTQSETRNGVVIKDNEGITSYFDPDPVVSEKELQEFLVKTKKVISNSELVIISGSFPKTNGKITVEEIISELIKYSNENDKITLLDSYSLNLNRILLANPLVVHLNKDEVKISLKENPESEVEYINVLNKLYKSGIKIIFITDGANKVYAMNQGQIYIAEPPKLDEINSTGSGDAFMAGIIYGLHNNYPFIEILKHGIALGMANAMRMDVASVPPGGFEKYLELINVISLL